MVFNWRFVRCFLKTRKWPVLPSQNKIGVSKRSVERSVDSMKSIGVLRRKGATKNGTWEVVSSNGLPPVWCVFAGPRVHMRLQCTPCYNSNFPPMNRKRRIRGRFTLVDGRSAWHPRRCLPDNNRIIFRAPLKSGFRRLFAFEQSPIGKIFGGLSSGSHVQIFLHWPFCSSTEKPSVRFFRDTLYKIELTVFFKGLTFFCFMIYYGR